MKQIDKIFILTLFFPALALAGFFRFESETLFTDRHDVYRERQMPIIESIQASYNTDMNDTALNTNFSFYDDPYEGEYDFKLYSLNAFFKPTDSLEIQVGRNFNHHLLVRATTIDSLALSWHPIAQITVSGYRGLQQQTELQNIDLETELSGGRLTYQSSNYFPLKIQTAVESLYYKKTDLTENIGKFTFSKQFESTFEPELITIGEWNMDSEHQNRADLGLSLYPSTQIVLNAHYQEYELDSLNGWEDPISTIFSKGKISEFSFGFSKFVSSYFSYSLELAASTYPLEDGYTCSGYKGTLDLQYRSMGNLVLSNQLQTIQSYGGHFWADIIKIQVPLWNKTDLSLSTEYVTYEKITSAKTDAFSTQIGLGTWIWDHYKFNLLAEYNKNNYVKDEVKVIGQLLIIEWTDI